MRMYRFPATVLTVVFLLGLSTAARAQSGTISGTVSDSTGAVIPSAHVTARDVHTDIIRTTTTNSQGFYEFIAVKPSTYEVAVEAKGFVRAVKHDINVVVGLESHFDVTLAPGSVSETVEVKAEVPLIEPDKTNVSYSIETQQIQNLPLQGRQFLDLALLTPGVTPQAPGTQAGGINVSGMRSQSNNFTLDGVSINDPQVNGPLNGFRIADAVQEFNVNTSIASTDLGRSAGAQVAVITKSGSNAYHGSAFYYGRNEALDANDWFLNSAQKPRNVLRRHQYGGTVGGWVIKDKTFWFLSFEGFREKSPLPQLSTVPTLAQRAAVTDPVSLKLLQFIPSPNTSGALGNWAGTADQFNNNETYLFRADHNLSANNRLMGHYAMFRGDTLTLQQNPFNGSITNLPGSQSAVIEETFSHTSWLNVVRLGYTRNLTDFAPQDVKINPASIFTDALGNPLPGFVDATKTPLNGGLPRITFASGFSNFGLGAGTNMPQGRTTNTYELIDNVTKTLNTHTLQFGGEVKREQTFRFLNGNFRGAISFASWATFATGQPRNGSLRTGGPDQTFRTWNRLAEYMYVQDSWKMKPNFTFNYGLRYELPGALVEKRDSGSNLVPSVGMLKLNSNLRIDVNPAIVGPGAITLTPVPGVSLPSSGQFSNATKNLAPFVGLAWSPKVLPAIFGDGKTVVRSGFRLSYDDVFANIPVNMGLNYPPVLSTTLPNSVYTWATVLNQNRRMYAADSTLTAGPTCGASPTPCRGILGFNAWDTMGKTAYAMNYTLEIERQIGRDYAVGASYVGTLGRRLGVFLDANEPFVNVVDPTKSGSATPNQRTFPFVQYSALPIGAFASSSNYNGMVLTAKKRPSHGLSLQASYTYGKSLDYNSSFFGSDREAGAFADPRNPQADYGPSAFDVRHQLVGSYLYELPFGKGRMFMRSANTVVEQFLGGWNVGGIVNWHTGFPFTIFANTATDFSGFNQFFDRPNAGNALLPINFNDPSHVFPTTKCPASPCYFSNPGAGSVGNMGRDAFYGPSYTDFDFSLQKNFLVTENKKFQLRADFFNLFNHPNFGLPTSNLGSSAAGTITSMNGNPRLMQLGLRFDF
jgi:Carboxypeptidase regulatory-like domain/TonB-dependent Receptor Plug Domain